MQNNKLKLVLLSCCAPCSGGAILQLLNGDIPNIDDFVVMFYNPNIYPEYEYEKRRDEQIRFCDDMGVKHIELEYNHEDWLSEIAGDESEPERGNRCSKCFRFRFRRAQIWANKNGYNAICSVLGISRHKSQPQVDVAAASVLTKISYLPVNWDEKVKNTVAKDQDFYRQNYCGCEFSKAK